ncbi:IS200/IS605 family transposase [Marinifilum sp. D737]|uniref:IS200/IS605 family transposase n=1 Tax=Marinifilum sp. D737 TaxID=2969628 RepID=UPI002274066A|nr:IS200/IS605 family transposase [Marinifilum sp. D737]MCY1636290.1 IS200/IS605 family transposase [Marinifilum sp. D737]
MPHVKVYIHFVWSTKCREPFLETPELRKKMWNHIKKNAKEKGIHVDFVNGYEDHCHCLVSLGSNQTLSKIMSLIKGESSHWINECIFRKPLFQWQEEYYAVSVSLSMLNKVREYIKNQETHHSHKSFDEEKNEMIEKFGFVKHSGV